MHSLLQLYKSVGEAPQSTGKMPTTGEQFVSQGDVNRFLGLDSSSYENLLASLEEALQKAADKFGKRFFENAHLYTVEAERFLLSKFPEPFKASDWNNGMGVPSPKRK